MWEVTKKKNLFLCWLSWHYSVALDELVQRLKNLLSFNLHYFSIPFLARTLFAPWRGYSISYGRGFDIKRFFDVLVFNVFSRIMGAIARAVVIVTGLISHILLFLLGVILLLLWLVYPLLLIFGIIISLRWLILI